MPFDDEADDDRPAGGTPLPPDDRLWRHPSELGPLAPSKSSAPTAGNSKAWAVAVVAGLIGSALSLGVVAVAGGFSREVVEKPGPQQASHTFLDSSSSESGEGVTALSKAVAPSVAHIEGTVGAESVVGSGIVIRDDGYVATNAHLVAHMVNMQVALIDGTTVPGKVVGTDLTTDIAVVQVERDHLTVASFGSATELESGQDAIAIGAPFGSAGGPTVTVGVISAIGRVVASDGGGDLHDMIQTDSPIASGSSGGALCDSAGAVIGMTTQVADEASSTGIGFAIPVDIVRAIADDIIAIGSARHPWLGVEGADLDVTNAHAIGVTGGAKVTKVMDDSPASLAGVHSDDIITTVDGVKVMSMAAFIVTLRSHHPGDAITLEIVRAGEAQTMTMTITLAERKTS